MTFLRFFATFMFLGTGVFADSFPAHFGVTDVAPDDRLNIRSAPNASAEILGDYGPDQLNIEVMRTSADGTWGFVSAGEGNGWVSMRFLERQSHLAVGEFPRPFQCGGTEPFWSVKFDVRGTYYSELATAQTYPLETIEEDISNRGTEILGGMAVLRQSPSVTRTVTFKRASCGDGMSDREFAWSANLLTKFQNGQTSEMGCCTMNSTD